MAAMTVTHRAAMNIPVASMCRVFFMTRVYNPAPAPRILWPAAYDPSIGEGGCSSLLRRIPLSSVSLTLAPVLI